MTRHILCFAQHSSESHLLVIHLLESLSSLANKPLPNLEAMHKTINLLSNLQLQWPFHKLIVYIGANPEDCLQYATVAGSNFACTVMAQVTAAGQ